jgi:hypothetical protein
MAACASVALTPRDFPRSDPFNLMPGTKRLLALRDGT